VSKEVRWAWPTLRLNRCCNNIGLKKNLWCAEWKLDELGKYRLVLCGRVNKLQEQYADQYAIQKTKIATEVINKLKVNNKTWN
jgi:hypothetical protein